MNYLMIDPNGVVRATERVVKTNNGLIVKPFLTNNQKAQVAKLIQAEVRNKAISNSVNKANALRKDLMEEYYSNHSLQKAMTCESYINRKLNK